MPGPLIKEDPNGLMGKYRSWVNEEPSVFDSLPEVLLRRTLKETGMDFPETTLMGGEMTTPLLAGVPPGEIAALRAGGKALLDKIKEKGIEPRSLGQRPMTPEGLEKWHKIPWEERVGKQTPDEYFMPNIMLDPELVSALEHAQTKYPRLFGHLKDISGIEALSQLQAFPNKINAAVSPIKKESPFSRLSLEAKPPAPVSTVGHELLHAADRIRDPKGFDDKYVAAGDFKDVERYKTNPYEARANKAGESFLRKYLKAQRPIETPIVEQPTSALEQPIAAEVSQPKTQLGLFDTIRSILGFPEASKVSRPPIGKAQAPAPIPTDPSGRIKLLMDQRELLNNRID